MAPPGPAQQIRTSPATYSFAQQLPTPSGTAVRRSTPPPPSGQAFPAKEFSRDGSKLLRGVDVLPDASSDAGRLALHSSGNGAHVAESGLLTADSVHPGGTAVFGSPAGSILGQKQSVGGSSGAASPIANGSSSDPNLFRRARSAGRADAVFPVLSGLATGPGGGDAGASASGGKWGKGSSRVTTVAEIVANASTDGHQSSHNSAVANEDAELDLYSRLVPTASVVPRNPRRALGGGGLRGTGSIAAQAISPSHAARSLSPISGGRSESSSSGRMQSLSSGSSAAQLARRRAAPQKSRRPISPSPCPGSESEISSSHSPPVVPVEEEEEEETQPEASNDAVDARDPGSTRSPASKSAPSPTKPQIATTPPAAGKAVDRSPPDSSATWTRAPEPVPLRRGQIENLRGSDGGPSPGTSTSSLASPATHGDGTSGSGSQSRLSPAPQTPQSHRLAALGGIDGLGSRGKALRAKSPPPRPSNSRADALRDAFSRRAPSQPPKPLRFSRATMGSSLSERSFGARSMELGPGGGAATASDGPARSPKASGATEPTASATPGASTLSQVAPSEYPSDFAKSPAARSAQDQRSSQHSAPEASPSRPGRKLAPPSPTLAMNGSAKPRPGAAPSREDEATPSAERPPGFAQRIGTEGEFTPDEPAEAEKQEAEAATLEGDLSLPTTAYAGVPRLGTPHDVVLSHDAAHDAQTASTYNQGDVAEPFALVGGQLASRSFGTGVVSMSQSAEVDRLPLSGLSLDNMISHSADYERTHPERSHMPDTEPFEDGLLPPLPDSRIDGDRFDSMLRSMGWQPEDDDDQGALNSFR